jgi:hypothetical protein
VTLLELYPFLLLLGVLGLVIVLEVRRLVAARVAARRFATAAIGLLAVVVILAAMVRLEAPLDSIPSGKLLSWQLGSVAPGSRVTASTAQTTTVVGIEVEHPGCTPSDGGSWLADPIVTYTPWSVTITMYLNDTTNCGSQQTPHEGLPLVGGYLMGTIYEVQLREPLGGRALLDGSSFPPQARPYR